MSISLCAIRVGSEGGAGTRSFVSSLWITNESYDEGEPTEIPNAPPAFLGFIRFSYVIRSAYISDFSFSSNMQGIFFLQIRNSKYR